MKGFTKTIIVLIILLLVFIAGLPTMLSTSWGRDFALKIANQRINGKISIEKLSLSWFGPQTFQGLELKDGTGSLVLEVDKFATKTPILKLIPESRRLENSVFKGLNLHLIKYPDGSTNLKYALSRSAISPFDRGFPLTIDLIDTNGNFVSGKAGDPMKLLLHGTTVEKGKKGTFDIQLHLMGTFNQLATSSLDDDNLKISASLVNFPVALLDEWLTQRGVADSKLLGSVIGDTINLDLIDSAGSIGHRFTLTANSPLFNADVDGIISNTRLVLTKPGSIMLQVTPEMMAKLDPNQPLSRTSQLALVINELNIPFKEVDSLFVKVQLDTQKSDPIFKELFGDQLLLSIKSEKEDKIQLLFENPRLVLDVLLQPKRKQLDGSLLLDNETSIAFVMRGLGTPKTDIEIFGDGLNGEILLREEQTLKGKIALKEFPIQQFCSDVCWDRSISRKIGALIGSKISGEVSGELRNLEGPIHVDIKGGTGATRFDGKIENRFLKLITPLVAQLKVTPQLGSEVLDEIFPLFGGAQQADSPITLTIIPEDFQFPLNFSKIEEIQIRHAQLNIGKVLFQRSPQMVSLLQLLNVRAKEQFNVWFTPLYFSMKEGTAKIQRIDMLVMEKYPFASWGKVNFIKDKVDFEVGIGSKAIEQAFQIGGLPKDYLLTVNLKGTTENVDLNTKKAAAKISALVAKTQGVEGEIIGTAIELITGAGGQKTPPPTTNPLPWDSGESEPNSKKKKKSKILNQVRARSSSMLKSLLGDEV